MFNWWLAAVPATNFLGNNIAVSRKMTFGVNIYIIALYL